MKEKTFLILLLLVLSPIFGDNSEMDDLFRSRKDKFNKTKSDKVSSFDKEREKRDQEFNNRIKESWEEFTTRKESFGLGPKPEKLPEAKVVELKEPEDTVKVTIPKPKRVMKPRPPKKPPVKKEVKFDSKTKKTTVNFYGDKLKVTYPKELSSVRLNSVTDSSISLAWESSSKTEYSPLVKQVESYIDRYKLNPWGVYMLVSSISSKIYKTDSQRVIFTGFMLTQLGMNCKIAHGNNKAYLILPSDKPLYSKPYLTIDNKRFYIITPVKGRLTKIKTYTADFPGVPKEFDLTIRQLPLLPEREVSKRLSFNYNGDKHNLNITYNKSLVDFFKEYPQTHYENYFETDLYHKSRVSLVKSLRPLIDGKGELEAVNFLLHFVQKSFEYQTDQEQFNREKPLFPEETLHYRYSDCEDRSVLFTYLVKELLGIEVVGLKYPGHMSTGVLLRTPVGNTVKSGNKTFTIADPTFINSNVGMAMPSYKDKTPEIIGIQ